MTKAHKARLSAARKAWWAKQPPATQATWTQADKARWKRYRLTPEQVTALLDKQANRCGVCQKDLTGRFTIDHDHDTGRLRGILCVPCNSSVEWSQDQKENLTAYLNRNCE